jgi:hypothetical protein
MDNIVKVVPFAFRHLKVEKPDPPEQMIEEHLDFLFALLKKGETNLMFFVKPLASKFDLPEEIASKIHGYWIFCLKDMPEKLK